MRYETFCGGIFETNCYLWHAPDGTILFDAPDGSWEWLQRNRVQVKLLLLTHGHIDHIADLAKIKETFDCCIDQNEVALLAENEKLWNAIKGLKNKGIRVRFVTGVNE